MAGVIGTDKKDRMLVAAIDLGTHFSTYAFSFKHDYWKNPLNVSTNQHGETVSGYVWSLNVPTVVLFNENKQFHNFGFKAKETYSELVTNGEHHKWYFFQEFKSKLYEKKIKRDLTIDDIEGRPMKAIDVFGAAIKCLKDHLLDILQKRGTLVENANVHWVLTVPAMWTNSAKQFLREAAYKAGIGGGQLSLVLEPEAASLYWQMIATDKIYGSVEETFSISSSGQKFMILDAGEKRTHITVYERQADGALKELYKELDNFMGGQNVDEEFYKLIIRLIGDRLWQKFIKENSKDFLYLQSQFKSMKRQAKPDSRGKITTLVPVSLEEVYNDETNEYLSDAIQGSRYAGKISWKSDKMRMDASVVTDLFKPLVNTMVNYVQGLLQTDSIKGTHTILMVGSNSEYRMVQDAMVEAFPNANIIISEEPQFATLKGAVIFGHRPVSITSRVSKYTYGINIFPLFDPAIHPEDHRISVGGMCRCRDVFKKYIIKGETVRVGEAHSEKHVTIRSHQTEMVLNVFASTKSNPMFVDEDDSEYLGTVVINLPKTSEKIRVDVNMIFGETELIVDVCELATHTKCSAYFEFL